MVALAYGSDVPAAMLEVVEFYARRIGLPLHLLEQMGSSLSQAERFILAAERGLGMAYAMSITYELPEGLPFESLVPALPQPAEAVIAVDR